MCVCSGILWRKMRERYSKSMSTVQWCEFNVFQLILRHVLGRSFKKFKLQPLQLERSLSVHPTFQQLLVRRPSHHHKGLPTYNGLLMLKLMHSKGRKAFVGKSCGSAPVPNKLQNKKKAYRSSDKTFIELSSQNIVISCVQVKLLICSPLNINCLLLFT